MKDIHEKAEMIKVGREWLTPEEAQKYLRPTRFDPSYKVITKLIKKGSPHYIVFQVSPIDDGEEWFIMCNKVKRKTGEILSSETLIRKDLETWITLYKNMYGFVVCNETL